MSELSGLTFVLTYFALAGGREVWRHGALRPVQEKLGELSPKAPDKAPAEAPAPAEVEIPAEAKAPAAQAPAKPRPKPTLRTATRPAWTRSQERLALLYNEQGLRPDEIARKLRLSPYQVAQIILNTRSRGKL